MLKVTVWLPWLFLFFRVLKLLRLKTLLTCAVLYNSRFYAPMAGLGAFERWLGAIKAG